MSTSKPRDTSLVLQPRDMALLESLFVSRVMTTAHAAALFFESRPEAAKKRLQILKSAGLIAERPRRSFDPAVLYLTKAGLSVLSENGTLERYPSLGMAHLEKRAAVSPLTIRHELDVMDVRVAFELALKRHATCSLSEFGTWPRLYEFESENGRGEPLLIRPDGFLRIRETDAHGASEHAFFLEVDRSSESLDTLVQKAVAYLHFFRSGGFAVRNGGKRLDAVKYPFRVLFVLKTEERRNNLAERLVASNPPILTMACLATADAVRVDPLGNAWLRPVDYRDAVVGSQFEIRDVSPSFGFKRRAERETFVKEKAALRALLGE